MMTSYRALIMLVALLTVVVVGLTITTIVNFSGLSSDQANIKQLAIANHTNSNHTLHKAVIAIERQRYDVSLGNCQTQNAEHHRVITAIGRGAPTEIASGYALLIADAAIPARDCRTVALHSLKVIGPPLPPMHQTSK